MGDKVTIKVLLNMTSRFAPYSQRDRLYEALVFESGLPACGDVHRLLEIVFEQLNIDEPKALWATEYRNHRNRSLSVGDVVVVGEQAWGVDRFGWTPVSVSVHQIFHHVGWIDANEQVLAQPRSE
jgi:hypothetical protein